MQIQKGLVKYKDRTDIVCTYGLTDDGKQYYFLDESSIPNGNIIASTVLVEAIDPVVAASSVGVIDHEGNVVIPFENKAVKSIGEGLLLVERATPVTQSVIDAIGLRSDPLAATKLVTTPATIKDNMNAKMGNDGRFVFNDQFSEATICDMNGNNLINNEYYSFIGIKNNQALYFSKNTVDSPVTEFVLPTAGGVEVPLPSETNEKLDVQSTDVTQATIDGAMVGDVTASTFEDMAQPQEEQVMVDNAVPPVETEATNTIETVGIAPAVEPADNNNGFSPMDVAGDISVNQVEMPIEPAVVAVPEESKEKVVLDSSLTADDTEDDLVIPKEETVEPKPEQAESTADTSLKLDLDDAKEEKNEVPVESDSLMAFDFKDNINYGKSFDEKTEVKEEKANEFVEDPFVKVDDFKKELFDVDLETDIFADSTLHADRIISDSFDDTSFRLPSKDTLMEDVASTLSNLIKQNKAQKEKLVAYEVKFEQVIETHKSVVEKARSQARDMDSLKSKIRNYETIVNKLENKIQSLEDKIHDQDRLIASQNNEIESLRPQAEGKRELARILADAQDLLEHAE